MILLIYTKDIVYTYIIAKLEVLFVKKYITINSFILTVISFLFVEIILFPNILYEAIPYQSYKLINNKEILPFEKVWYDVWKNINNLTIREQITITTYIVNYINPDFTPAYIVRGDAYFTNKDYINALQDYTIAIEQQPNNAEIYYKRGLTYNYLKDFYSNAINDFKQATDLNNNVANFWAEYSYALKFSHYGADEMLAKAIAINPQYKNFNYNELEQQRTTIVYSSALEKALFYSYIGNYFLADKYFEIVNRLNYLPKQVNINYNYIINMMKSAILSGHFESAFYIGKHFLSTNSNNLNNDKLAEVYMWEAFACAGIYKDDLFVQYKNLALNLSPKNPQVYCILGNIYWKIYDDTSNAIDNYQKALNLMPKENLDYFILSMELAQIYKNLGDITKAYAIAYNMIISQKELPNIENINPLDTPIYLTYAKAYDILGNTQLAKIYYQIAFNLNPNIDIPEKYYPNKVEKLQYLPSIIIDINDTTAIELKTNIFN